MSLTPLEIDTLDEAVTSRVSDLVWEQLQLSDEVESQVLDGLNMGQFHFIDLLIDMITDAAW